MSRPFKQNSVEARTMRQRGFITAREAAYRARRPRRTIYRWIQMGTVKSCRVGQGSLYVDEASLDELLGPLGPRVGADP